MFCKKTPVYNPALWETHTTNQAFMVHLMLESHTYNLALIECVGLKPYPSTHGAYKLDSNKINAALIMHTML